MADKFQSGDRVFAKIKGWPPWPAKVLSRAEGKHEAYLIQFFGTYDTSTVKPDNIFVYDDANKAKYGKPKNNGRWKEAMEEIENNTLIGDNGPLEEEEQELPAAAAAPAVEAAADPDTDGDGELMIDEGPPQQPPVLTKEVVKPATTSTPTNGKPQPEQPKGRRGSKASLSKRDSISSVSSATEVSTPTAAAAPPATEMVSRSGRKIKPKRFADDEISTTPTKTKGAAANLDDSSEPPLKRPKRGGKTPPSAKVTPAPVEQKEPVRARMVIGKGRGAPVKPNPNAGRLSPDISAPVPKAPALKPAAVIPPNQRRSAGAQPVASAAPTKKPLPALIPASGAVVAATIHQAAPIPPGRRAPSLRQQPKPDVADEESESEPPPVLAVNTEEVETDDKENLKDNAASSNDSEMESDEEAEKNSEMDDTASRYSEALDETLTKIPFTDKEGEQYELRFEAKDDLETEDERVEYDATVNAIEKIKEDLEQGDQDTHETLQELLEANKDEFDTEEGLLRERRAAQIRTLRVEGEVIEIIGEIVSCLGEKQAECYRALELLERLGSHDLTALILKKHPEVVHTVARLRNYIGNMEQWEMTEDQTAEFKESATAIRVKAAEIYLNFYNVFTPPEDRLESVTFEEIFKEEMKVFRELTHEYTLDEILGLTAENEDGGFEMYEAGEIET